MRKGSALLVATIAALVLSAGSSHALSCWQCPGARDTCNYYTQTTFERCVDGCRRMGFNDEEDSCNQGCGEDGMGNERDCITAEQDCWRSCDGGVGGVQRPWYIPY